MDVADAVNSCGFGNGSCVESLAQGFVGALSFGASRGASRVAGSIWRGQANVAKEVTNFSELFLDTFGLGSELSWAT